MKIEKKYLYRRGRVFLEGRVYRWEENENSYDFRSLRRGGFLEELKEKI